MDKKLIALTIGCLAFSSPLAGASETKLTADEIRSEIIGHTMVFETASGVGGLVEYALSGEISGSLDSGAQDTGKWRLKGNAICVTWNEWRGGEEGCWVYARMKNGKIRYNSTTSSSSGTAWRK